MAGYFLPDGMYSKFSEDQITESALAMGWDGETIPEPYQPERMREGHSLAEAASLGAWKSSMNVTPYMEGTIRNIMTRTEGQREPRHLYRGLQVPDGQSAATWAAENFPVGESASPGVDGRPFVSFTASRNEGVNFGRGGGASQRVLLEMTSVDGLDLGGHEQEVLFEAHRRRVLDHRTTADGEFVVSLGDVVVTSALEAGNGAQDALRERRTRFPELFEQGRDVDTQQSGYQLTF